MNPTVKSIKVYLVIESVIETKCSPAELHEFLHAQRFRGKTEVNYNEGGITNAVTKEHIPITMSQVDEFLKRDK